MRTVIKRLAQGQNPWDLMKDWLCGTAGEGKGKDSAITSSLGKWKMVMP